MVDDISHQGLRVLLAEQGVSFQRLKTWKQSRDRAYEAKKNRILHLYGLMDGTADVEPADPDVVICVDEFGPLNLQPHPGRQWALSDGGGQTPRRRRRATYKRPHGVRHLLAAYDFVAGQAVRAYQAAQAPRRVPGIPAVCAQPVSAHGADRDRAGQLLAAPVHQERPAVGRWAAANDVELAYTPTNASHLNRIEAQFTALRYFTLDGADHASHQQQGDMIRRYIAWRNRNAHDKRLKTIINRANVA